MIKHETQQVQQGQARKLKNKINPYKSKIKILPEHGGITLVMALQMRITKALQRFYLQCLEPRFAAKKRAKTCKDNQ